MLEKKKTAKIHTLNKATQTKNLNALGRKIIACWSLA